MLAVGIVMIFTVIDWDKLCEQLVAVPEEILINSISWGARTLGIIRDA